MMTPEQQRILRDKVRAGVEAEQAKRSAKSAAPVACAKLDCTGVATGFPALRERGRNSAGIVFDLPLCPDCLKATKVVDLVPDERHFRTMKGFLEKSAMHVHRIEDLELHSIPLNSTDAPLR